MGQPERVASIYVRLLGRFDVRSGTTTVLDDAWPRARARALLKLLVLARGHALRRAEAEASLWPDLGAAAAANNLRKNVHYLRTAFGSAGVELPIRVTDDSVALEADVWLDVDAFQEEARRARAQRLDPAIYEQALALYGGALRVDDLDPDHVRQLRDHLPALFAELLFELSELHLARAEYDEAGERLNELLRMEPAHEEAHRALMRLYAWTGQRHLAMRQYTVCRDAMRAEFDVGPSAETDALHGQIRDQRLGTPARPAGRFVGRQRELAVLRASLDDAMAGSGSVVVVGGEPGVGKTRFVQEFALYAHLRGAGVVWTYCADDGSSLAFQPWVQAIRGIAALAPPGDTEAVRPGQFAPEFAHTNAAPVDGAVSPPEARVQMFQAAAEYFRLQSRGQPLVIVIDDVHGATAPTLRLLEYLSRELQAAHTRIVIVTCCRDAARRTALAPTLSELARQPRNRDLTLFGLDRAEVGVLVAAVAGSEPSPALADAVHAATGGNPFRVHEAVRLIERDPAAQLKPQRPGDVTDTRLHLVPDACRRVLEVAAVIGLEFDADLLQAVGQWHGVNVVEQLREATREHLVVSVSDAGGRYRFAHALVREALYSGLPATDRPEVHRRTAEALEAALSATGQQDLIPDIARHFSEAARADGDVEKAIEYTMRASDAAQQVYAWEQTVDYWKSALELMERGRVDPERIVVLLERLQDLIFRTGDDYAGGLAYLERVLALRERLGQHKELAEAHYRLALARSPHGPAANHLPLMDIPDALDHYYAAEDVLARTLEGPALAFFYISLGLAAFYAIRNAEALSASSRAMEIAGRVGVEPLWATANGVHGLALRLDGRLREGRRHLEVCWEISDRQDDLTLSFLTATNIADWHEGYARGGGEIYRRELAKPRIAKAPRERAGLVHDLGAALSLSGELAEARRLFDEEPNPGLAAMLGFCDGRWEDAAAEWGRDLDTFEKTGNRYTHSARSYLLAEVRIAQGDAERAEQALRAALVPALDGQSVMVEMRVRPGLALLCALSGKLAESRDHIAHCRAIMARGEDWGRRAARVDLAAGVLAARDGRMAEADDALRRAGAAFAERCLPWDEAETLIRWGQVALGAGTPGAAAQKFAQASAIYKRMAAGRPWMERLDTMAAMPVPVPTA